MSKTALRLKPSPRAIREAVDQLGIIKAQIAPLREQEEALRKILIAAGVGNYCGDAYDASVSHADRETLDMDAVRAKLSPQFIAAHTRITGVDIVKVTARKGDVLK